MAGKICQTYLLTLNNAVLSTLSSAFRVRLYSNNKTPAVGDAVGAYTECAFAGYAAIALALPPVTTWDAGNSKYVNSFLANIYTYTGGATSGNIYGYYVTDGGGNLTWAELLAGAPLVLSPAAPNLSISPVLDGALNEF